jgi:hypothetical protein
MNEEESCREKRILEIAIRRRRAENRSWNLEEISKKNRVLKSERSDGGLIILVEI